MSVLFLYKTSIKLSLGNACLFSWHNCYGVRAHLFSVLSNFPIVFLNLDQLLVFYPLCFQSYKLSVQPFFLLFSLFSSQFFSSFIPVSSFSLSSSGCICLESLERQCQFPQDQLFIFLKFISFYIFNGRIIAL